MKDYAAIAWRNMKRRKKRLVLTILGVVLSCALITAITTMLYSFQENALITAVKEKGTAHAFLSNVSAEQADTLLENVRFEKAGIYADEGGAVAGTFTPDQVKYYQLNNDKKLMVLKAGDSEALKMMPIELMEGRLPQNGNEIVLDTWCTKAMGAKVGDTIQLDIHPITQADKEAPLVLESGNGEKKTFTVCGITKSVYEYSTIATGQGITLLNGTQDPAKAYNMAVRIKGGYDVGDAVKSALSEAGASQATGSYNTAILSLEGRSGASSMWGPLLTTALFLIFIIVIATVSVIYNSFNISVVEKVQEYGMLRVMGASPAQVKRMVFREAGIAALIGIPLGVACGVGAVYAILAFMGTLAFSMFENFTVVLNPWVLAGSAAIALASIYLSAWLPARYAGKITPVGALRGEGLVKKEKKNKLRKARLSKLLFGFTGQMAARNMRRDRRRFRLTVYSMIISITLFIVVNGLLTFGMQASPFKEANIMDVQVSSAEEFPLSNADYEFIKNQKGVDYATRLINHSMSAEASESQLNPDFGKAAGDTPYVIADGKAQIVAEMMSCGDENLTKLERYITAGSIDLNAMQNGGVIVFQKNKIENPKNRREPLTLDLTQYKPGDEIRLSPTEGGTGKERTVKVAAVISELPYRSSPNNRYITLVTTDALMQELTGKNTYDAVGVKFIPNTDRKPFLTAIENYSADKPWINVTDFSELVQRNNDAMLQVEIFLYGFVVVVSLIGFLNIINTISTNMVLRSREFGVLRAVGTSGAQLKQMTVVEALFSGLKASVWGVVIGTILHFCVFLLISGLGSTSYILPYESAGISVAAAIIISLLSSLIPLRKISRKPIVEAIRNVE